MSIPTVRQPAGTPVGGQFATTARPETGLELAPAVTGLVVPDDLDEPTRKLVDALDAAGLNGTVQLAEFTSPGWSRVEVNLPSGHELTIGVARSDGTEALRREGTITAITAYLRATDAIDDEEEVKVHSFGGSHGEVAIGEHVHQALIASAARAEFTDRFPDAADSGCTLEWIGQENAPTAWRRIDDPQPQIDGARFTVPGGEVVVTTLDGDVDIEADGRSLRANETYLRELAAGDVTRRLGLVTGGSSAEALAAAVTEVIASSRRRPVIAANLRPRP